MQTVPIDHEDSLIVMSAESVSAEIAAGTKEIKALVRGGTFAETNTEEINFTGTKFVDCDLRNLKNLEKADGLEFATFESCTVTQEQYKLIKETRLAAIGDEERILRGAADGIYKEELEEAEKLYNMTMLEIGIRFESKKAQINAEKADREAQLKMNMTKKKLEAERRLTEMLRVEG